MLDDLATYWCWARRSRLGFTLQTWPSVLDDLATYQRWGPVIARVGFTL
ncbi:hypothetical protein [Amycolatopsis sp. SID8362]|nr:hypothetical protein [Amycolatopsis sp. SID8362]NBH07905.1 hypothetical protein [Amycolatopsis sp. SID8362]NED44600.1 hypothetical protein [Amycolatopsis sp. SID8362]